MKEKDKNRVIVRDPDFLRNDEIFIVVIIHYLRTYEYLLRPRRIVVSTPRCGRGNRGSNPRADIVLLYFALCVLTI